MNKDVTLIYKLRGDVKFPYQRFNLVKPNSFVGIVYKDKNNQIKEIGVFCKVIGFIKEMFQISNQNFSSMNYIKLEAVCRIKILEYQKINEQTDHADFAYYPIEILEDELITKETKEKITTENLITQLESEAQKYFLSQRLKLSLRYEGNHVKFVFAIIPYLPLLPDHKQKLLEINDHYERIKELTKALKALNEHLLKDSVAHFNNSQNNSNEKIKRSKRSSSKADVIEDLENKIDSTNMTEEAKKIALEELEKLKSQSNNPEKEWIVNYLNVLLSLPWDKTTKDNEDINHTRQILDRDHFGLNKIKKRIVEYLSVRKLNANSKRGSILCFNGPPGVGKTSLAKSIADALGKNFYRLSLGGVRDESEIRGHRRTYISSMPGTIIQALRRVETKNPVILLDEIDKVGSSNIKGDVSSCLLEVLDPEQNHTFKDHFINTPFDLSEIIFICTSNFLENVSPPLRDRLEVIEIPGYTIQEKSEICKRYLIPKQIKENGLDNQNIKLNITFADSIIESLISDYTFESGVRQLERNVASVCRYIASIVVQEMDKAKDISKNESVDVSNQIKINKDFIIDEVVLKKVLGRKQLKLDLEFRTSKPGIAIGLAYTLNGGAITLIETSTFKGQGDMIITGNMGDIMKESVRTALSWIKSNSDHLGISDFDFNNKSIHVHVPQAAVPKDGPSAGITIAMSIISLLKSSVLRKDTAMTGEISLQGYVLPVGGIKEKCLAALRNNIKRVIVPYENKYDVEELPKETKENLEFIFAKDIKEVIKNSLDYSYVNNQVREAKPKF